MNRAFDGRPHDTWLLPALLSCERHVEQRSKAEVQRWTTTGQNTLRPPTGLNVLHVTHLTQMLLDCCPDNYNICIVSSFFFPFLFSSLSLCPFFTISSSCPPFFIYLISCLASFQVTSIFPQVFLLILIPFPFHPTFLLPFLLSLGYLSTLLIAV